ncbi:MAG: DEAD/DEAH box helicase [Pirellulales bacterium]|nr:DEAD/DEAH box helicase [Pirellulales bacterium]
MTQWKSAGILGRLLSSLRPKKLVVQVRSEEQPDGTITLTPVCLVAGREVDPALVRNVRRQRILGYSVAADPRSLSILRQGPIRLPKRKAAENLAGLARLGIPVCHQATGTQTDVQEVMPRVENDSLESLTVFGAGHENRVTVDGDRNSIQVSPRLVLFGKNRREHVLTPEDLALLQRQSGCRRIPEGWIDIDLPRLEEHRQAYRELRGRIGRLSSIEGFRIPETLHTLLEQERFTSSWTVCLSHAVKEFHRIVDSPADVEFRLQVVESDGRSGLEIMPVYNYGRFELTHADHLQALARREPWIRRENAWIKVDQEACNRIEAVVKRLGLQPGEEGYAFRVHQREEVIEAFSPLGWLERSAPYEEFLAQLADLDRIGDVPLPATLRPGITLRPYQKQGFNWLAFLHRFGLGGILADDMGLGKTLQTLAILQRAKEQGRGNLPSLIICPTSVVSNWQSEAEKFFTDCPVILYTGSNRAAHQQSIRRRLKRPPQSLSGPLVVTSYDIARRDHKRLARIPWLYVIVDEGHNIKNPSAKRTKAIKAIPAQHKLALTGTPIQNRLEELWSLFDFAMPGFLGTHRGFRDKYGRYDEVDWDAVQQGPDSLKDRIRPFVLRRLKENVAKDLPPKIVVDQKVELSDLQVDLYQHVLASADYRRVFEEVEAKGVPRAKMLILKVYTTLRAICNHPALAKELYRGGAVNCGDSGKLQCLKELMEEIVDGEHRVLLFSQSTRMLDIIEGFFRQWRHAFLRLDGDTPPPLRPDLVRQFNDDRAIACFLISTRAGGTGLNLTGADTVIFYDHDWNPANDHQAQDRAYRIGQTKPVTVYRLISQGTIEEKILHRQEVKQTLADEVIAADEGGFKDLDRNELLRLFRLDERRAA